MHLSTLRNYIKALSDDLEFVVHLPSHTTIALKELAF